MMVIYINSSDINLTNYERQGKGAVASDRQHGQVLRKCLLPAT